jgi:hypothetical protein
MRCAVLVLIGWSAAHARAQAPESAAVSTDTAPTRVHVEADGECPSAKQLEDTLEPLLGPGRVALDGESRATDATLPVQARVSDRGERYLIEIRSLQRELEDRARDCVERARVAAVLIALNVGEAERKPPPEPPPVERVERVEPPPPAIEEPAAPEPLAMGMQLLGSGELATEIERGAFGGSVGVWWSADGFGVALDAGLLSPVTLTLEPRGPTRGRAALMRVPFTLSGRYLIAAGAFALGPALGLSLDVLRVAGSGVEREQTAVRVSFGGFLALEAHAELGAQLEAVLRLNLRAFPSAYRLAVPPEGALGETPQLWVGASLGLGWRFR